jgi:hypothetical protein
VFDGVETKALRLKGQKRQRQTTTRTFTPTQAKLRVSKSSDDSLKPFCLLAEVIGGRGRNRTYNLSVKSRMLCQLSYASSIEGGKAQRSLFFAAPSKI